MQGGRIVAMQKLFEPLPKNRKVCKWLPIQQASDLIHMLEKGMTPCQALAHAAQKNVIMLDFLRKNSIE